MNTFDQETAPLRDYIRCWFVARKQDALNTLLTMIWDELVDSDYSIAEILRSFASYAHNQGIREAVIELERIAITLEQSQLNQSEN